MPPTGPSSNGARPPIGGRNPIGAPFGRKTQWGVGPEEPRRSRDRGDAPQRGSWDDRGGRGSWDDRAGDAAWDDGARRPWDDRGAAPQPSRAGPRPSWGGTIMRGPGAPGGPPRGTAAAISRPLPPGRQEGPPARPAMVPPSGARGGGPSATLTLSNVAREASEDDLRRLCELTQIQVASVQMQRDRALIELRLEPQEDAELAADFAAHRLQGAKLGGAAISVAGSSTGGRGAAGFRGGVGPTALEPPTAGAPGKRLICAYWREGRCSRGAACAYAHGEHELEPEARARYRATQELRAAPPRAPPAPAPAPAGRKAQICAYWRDGRCTRGNLCAFSHGAEDCPPLRPPAAGARAGAVGEAGRGRFEGRSGRRAASRSRSRSGAARRPTVREPPPPKALVFAKAAVQLEAVELPAAVVHAPPEEEKTEEAKGSEAATVDDGGVEVVGEELAAAKGKAEPGKKKSAAGDPPPVAFLTSEDGMAQLAEMYGLGAKLLQEMGWKLGAGLGRRAEGGLEPVSVLAFKSTAMQRGRRDRRCLGRKPRRKFVDSDAASSLGLASDASSRSRSSSSKRSRSKRTSESRPKRTKRAAAARRRKRRRRSRSSVESSPSRSSSDSSKSSRSSSSSSSSSGRRRRKKRAARRRAKKSKPKAESAAKEGGGFSNTAGEGGATAGAAAAAVLAPQPTPAAEPPEIAQAKKNVLAKLTVMKNVEPKEERAKQFRLLLREWHPDKNPERIDMATAVFQFLQKGKSLLNLK